MGSWIDVRGVVLGLALGPACGTGGPAGEASGGLSVGSVGEGSTSSGGTGNTSPSSSGPSSVDASTTGASESETGAPTCTDGAQNGDETDIDCGGSCSPCDAGHACVAPADCSSRVCEDGLCCTTSTYEKSTGEISGSALVCCEGDDARLNITKCGTGQNYSADPEGANCATTTEGAMNNGSACVTITCQALACMPADTGTTM